MGRKIFVLTGKRGGFGAMKPMLRALRDDDDFQLQLVVTDQHVSDKFGRTVSEVEKEFPVAAAVDIEQTDSTRAARSRAMGTCLHRMTDVLVNLAPDVCVLYGDRSEVLATATAATILGIPIAHLQGGDVSGSIDEPMRHAITKLAHLHFPSTKASAERIRKMGEEEWRIEVVGDNHVDLIVAGEYATREEVLSKLDLPDDKPVLTLLQHSETTAPEAAYEQMLKTLDAVADVEATKVVVYPCSDPGYEGVIAAISERATGPDYRVHKNLEAPLFWGLLSISRALVGNSSAGLIETPYFCIPAVNIGRRQTDRLHAENVLHVPHESAAIRAAIETAMTDGPFRRLVDNCSRPFGDGQAGRRVVEALRRTPLDGRLRVKRITY